MTSFRRSNSPIWLAWINGLLSLSKLRIPQTREEAEVAGRTVGEESGAQEGRWGATSSWEEAKTGEVRHRQVWEKTDVGAKPQRGEWEDRAPREDLVKENDILRKASTG